MWRDQKLLQFISEVFEGLEKLLMNVRPNESLYVLGEKPLLVNTYIDLNCRISLTSIAINRGGRAILERHSVSTIVDLALGSCSSLRTALHVIV